MVRQGYLSKRLLKYEEFHTLKFYDADTIRGYHWWAVPFTKLMKRSKVATMVGKLFIFRAKEVAKILGKEPKGSIIGKIINAVVPRICKIIGKFVKYDKFDPRWDRADSERIIKVEK